MIDSLIRDGLWDPYGDILMGNCAEVLAKEGSYSREEQDTFAVESYRRSIEAIKKLSKTKPSPLTLNSNTKLIIRDFRRK